jgi:hypothetical protein
MVMKNNELTEKIKNLDFKITSKNFMNINKTDEKVGSNIMNESRYSRFSSFEKNEVKSFSSYSGNNINTNNTEVDFFKKKCSVLEENIKELTQKYTKELVNLKTKILERNSEDIINLNRNKEDYSEVYEDMNNKYNLNSRHSSSSKKKTLTPLTKSMNTPLKSSHNKNSYNNYYNNY